MITEDRFREVFNVVEKHLEDRYELPVVITDVPKIRSPVIWMAPRSGSTTT
jgi:hypothetical protein